MASGTLFDTPVSDIQTDVTVSGQYISGTSKFLDEGAIAGYWGSGYFLAVQFDDIPDGATVKVGLDPSMGSGYVELDEDRNGVFKITNKNNQVFKVITTKGDQRKVDTYYLGNIILEPTDA